MIVVYLVKGREHTQGINFRVQHLVGDSSEMGSINRRVTSFHKDTSFNSLENQLLKCNLAIKEIITKILKVLKDERFGERALENAYCCGLFRGVVG